MHGKIRFGWALGLLVVGACGGSSGDAGVEEGERPASSDCDRGQFAGGTGTLKLCGPGLNESGCMPIEKFKGYTKYAGDIAVYPESLPDLSALKCLREVGRLTIGQSKELTDLRGLENVATASAVEILGNEKLTSLTGFEKLRSVIQITINSNDSLTDLVGLPEGFSTGSLYVEINWGLTSLEGLAGIEVERRIAFEGNEKLSSCAVEKFGSAYPGVELINEDNLSEACP